jgi:superfamily II DNA or RNA helicase
MTLRPYQTDLIEAVSCEYRAGHRHVVMQLGTGGGKTHTAAEIIARAVAKGRRVLFLAHLDALIDDTARRLAAAGVHTGIIQGAKPTDPTAPVQVCSFQSLHTRGERPPADLLIVDECHRVMGASVLGIVESYPNAHVLGLTATPQRGDGQSLGDVFTSMVCGPSVRALTEAGHLVPCDVVAPETYEDRGLTTTPLEAYRRWAPDTRAIIFCANVAHAEETRIAFGAGAELIVGDTKPKIRRGLRERLASGETRVLVGVGVFIEGFDWPGAETVILARQFGVTGSFLQAVGRGLRASTGKTTCTLIDLRGSVHLHGFPDEDRRWSLTGPACVRVERLPAVARCKACLALFRPQPRCPRCGAGAESLARVPRDLNRADRLEMLSGMSQMERDRRYLTALERVARERVRLDGDRAVRWALARFKKRFNRSPGERAA